MGSGDQIRSVPATGAGYILVSADPNEVKALKMLAEQMEKPELMVIPPSHLESPGIETLLASERPLLGVLVENEAALSMHEVYGLNRLRQMVTRPSKMQCASHERRFGNGSCENSSEASTPATTPGSQRRCFTT